MIPRAWLSDERANGGGVGKTIFEEKCKIPARGATVVEADEDVAGHSRKENYPWHQVYQRKTAFGNGKRGPRDG